MHSIDCEFQKSLLFWVVVWFLIFIFLKETAPTKLQFSIIPSTPWKYLAGQLQKALVAIHTGVTGFPSVAAQLPHQKGNVIALTF